MTYRVKGEDRKEGAIGLPQPFVVDVEAIDNLQAREIARNMRYLAGREHVHCSSVERITPIPQE